MSVAPEKRNLRLGFVRLTDCAPIVCAKALGFFEDFGLDVTLRREVSWANIRDRLVSGHLDAAPMPAPLPIMTSLGASGMRANLVTGLVLSRNGNAITLSLGLARQAARLQAQREATGQGLTLAGAVHELSHRRGSGLNLGTVHAVSNHTMVLRDWLSDAGLVPDVDARLIVVPPSQMVDSLASGFIDGFCVGEPWNTLAVAGQVGSIALPINRLMAGVPEKVLTVSSEWHRRHPDTHLCLRAALLTACRWLEAPDNRLVAAKMLSEPAHLDIDEAHLLPALEGKLRFAWDEAPQPVPDMLRFAGDDMNCPVPAQLRAILLGCNTLLGDRWSSARLEAAAEQCFREDLFRETESLAELVHAAG